VIFDRLGAIVSRRWMLVLLLWAAAVCVIHQVAPRWNDITHDGDFAYLPDRMTSVRGEKLAEVAFPDALSKSQVALVVSRADGKLKERDFEVADRLLRKFTPAKEGMSAPDYTGPITAVWSYESQVVGKKLISRAGDNGQAVLIVLRLRNEFMAIDNMPLMAEIHRTLEEIRGEKDFPEGLELGVTGSAAIGTDMLFSAEESIRNTELTTIGLVILILLIVYRAPGLVVVPLVTITASVLVACDLVAILVQCSGWVDWFDFKIFKTTKIFVVVILFGAGTDYCLFLISRYKEELGRGLSHEAAIAESLARVGDALAASAMTTIFGLGMMVFADFGKFRYSGPAIALCLVVALVACISLAPALLRGAGRIVFWPFGVGPVRAVADQERAAEAYPAGSRLFAGFWQRLSRAVIARPGLILTASVLLLAPLAWEGLSVPITYDLLGELRADRPSVEGTRLLRRHFCTGETGPVSVLAYHEYARFDTKEGRGKISRLTKYLYDLEYVDDRGVTTRPIISVRSRTEPLGGAPGKFNPFSAAVRDKLAVLNHPKTKATFISQAAPLADKVTRFELIFPYDPFSRESVELLGYVEEQLLALAEDPKSDWYGATFDLLGTTAGIRDLESVTASDRVLIQVLVVIAVLAVLILILRRPAICIYLILSVLFGYFVTIGTTELFFSWLYGPTYHGLDWKVPIFLFVILIAVGEDYNIYLATRVFEEQRRRGLLEGLRVALVRTGGIITSCGVIMAGTFASMTTGTLRGMHELGFALSLGVLLDTFIIRTILVPAFLALLARRSEEAGDGAEAETESQSDLKSDPMPQVAHTS